MKKKKKEQSEQLKKHIILTQAEKRDEETRRLLQEQRMKKQSVADELKKLREKVYFYPAIHSRRFNSLNRKKVERRMQPLRRN